MKLNFNIRLTGKQQEAYDLIHRDDIRFLIAAYSRQCGKTVLAEILMIEYLCKPNLFSAYISPTFSQGKKVYAEIIALLDGKGIILKANASDLTITTVFGSQLKFFSMESPNSIRGYTVSGILVLDEAAFFPVTTSDGQDPWFNVIYPITKARKPKVFMISTPNGKQGMFFEMYMRGVNNYRSYAAITATIYDDELITKEEIEELKRNYPPLAFQQEFECKFLSNALTVFPNFEECFNIDVFDTRDTCWCGIDPSSVGDDNTIVTFINSKNEVRQYKVEGSLDTKYDKIGKLINEHNPRHTYCEDNSIGEVMANEIKKKLKAPSKFSTFNTNNPSKKDYIGLIQIAVDQLTVHFEKTNTLLYSEMATFTYKLTKAGNVTYAARSGCHDDTVTSLGMAMQCKEDYKFSSSASNVFINSNTRYIR